MRGMRKSDGWICVINKAIERVLLADAAPKHGIHKPARAPGEVDGFVDGGVMRHAHAEDLVKAQPQDLAREAINCLLAELCDEEIDEAEIAQDAVKNFREERAIKRREFVRSQHV